MAVILIATPSGITSNTYCLLSEANSYFEAVIDHSNVWEPATEENKNKSLVWATRLIDESYQWNGVKAIEAQSLRWPRSSVYDPDGILLDYATIPNFLRNATAEMAKQIMVSDRLLPRKQQVQQKEVGSLKMIYFELKELDFNSTIIPRAVHHMLQAYGLFLEGDNAITALQRV
jgi:hypothetical protein